MKNSISDEGGAGLRHLLRQARPDPELPPGFQQAVWRRVEQLPAETPASSTTVFEWLVSLIPHPRWALATLSVMLLVGGTLGVRQGAEQANDAAKARYVASVGPALSR